MSWWRNGRRRGLKIPIPGRGVWVRVPPRIQFDNDRQRLEQQTKYLQELHIKAEELLKDLRK